MVCSSLPNFNSSTLSRLISSEVFNASASSCALRIPRSGDDNRRMVNAISGVDPFAMRCLYELRSTAFGSAEPYPTSPFTVKVPEAKTDFCMEKPVLMSEIEPKPSEGAPATKERVPFKSVDVDLSATITGEPSGRMRRTGRFAVEGNTQSQSPSSDVPSRGVNCSASKTVDRVRFNKMVAPALRLIFSRRVGKKEGAETLTL